MLKKLIDNNYVFCEKCRVNPCECKKSSWEERFKEFISYQNEGIEGANHYYIDLSTEDDVDEFMEVLRQTIKEERERAVEEFVIRNYIFENPYKKS